MDDLRELVRQKFKELDEENPLEVGDSRWNNFRRLARVDDEKPNLEYLLSKAKIAADFLGDDEGKLEGDLLSVAESVICGAVDFVNDGTDLSTHEAFLRRIARRPARRARVKIFTTNYDKCFESAAARSGFIVIDGFSFGANASFNSDQFSYDVVRRDSEERADYVENLFHLLKMHGSIDWEKDEVSGRVLKRPGTKKPILIYPRSTKYEMAFSQPYVDLMASFQGTLRSSGTTLFVLGFGFNDKHIVEPIIAAVRSNLSFNLVVVDPSLGEKCEDGGKWANDNLVRLMSFIDSGDGRIALIEGRFEDVVPLIPDIVAETDQERHQQRMRNPAANG